MNHDIQTTPESLTRRLVSDAIDNYGTEMHLSGRRMERQRITTLLKDNFADTNLLKEIITLIESGKK